MKRVDKGNEPFNTIHLDHYGPIKLPSSGGFKHILVVVDAFTKFVKFYPTKTTNSDEVLKHLSNYINYYSKPARIVSDRGACFTSIKFENFAKNNCIDHIKTAAYTPEANGQAERVNRTLMPMLSKLINDTGLKWNLLLNKMEYIFNNTYNRSVKNYPSILLFGSQQRNLDVVDHNLKVFVNNFQNSNNCIDLQTERNKAMEIIQKNQLYNKTATDKKRKKVTEYKVGDFVVIKSVSSTKLSEKFKGPYIIHKILPNDRYVITDIEGFQASSIPFHSVCSPGNMKLWLSPNNLIEYNLDLNDENTDEDIG